MRRVWTLVAVLGAFALLTELCTLEIDVPGALARCIRVMVHANLPASQTAEHVYLRGAVALRPDLGKLSGDE